MKKKGDSLQRHHGAEAPGITLKKKTGSKNKGVLGFLKK
jgi:hypothetical protein